MRYMKWKQIKIVSDGCTDERAFHETSAFLERREIGTRSCQTVLRHVFETIRNIRYDRYDRGYTEFCRTTMSKGQESDEGKPNKQITNWYSVSKPCVD